MTFYACLSQSIVVCCLVTVLLLYCDCTSDVTIPWSSINALSHHPWYNLVVHIPQSAKSKGLV